MSWIICFRNTLQVEPGKLHYANRNEYKYQKPCKLSQEVVWLQQQAGELEGGTGELITLSLYTERVKRYTMGLMEHNLKVDYLNYKSSQQRRGKKT